MKYTITLQERHYTELKDHLLSGDSNEHVAFIICGRSLVDGVEERLLSREVVTLADDKLISSDPTKVAWDNQHFIEVLKKTESKNFSVVVVHNHPEGFDYFSEIDDKGEKELFQLTFNRNGYNAIHASLVLLTDGNLIGRVWKTDLSNTPISLVRIIGKRIVLNYPDKTTDYETPEVFNRQQLAFGKALVQDLSKLKISVVGAGATGSATALLLTRLGVGELCLIDKDTIEQSNLNRLHGAKISDVGKYKVDVLQQYINEIGIGTKVSVAKGWVSDQECINHLKTSDLIFGCTDDNSGRILLNRFAYFYLTPVIDMGLIIKVKEDNSGVQDLQGRTSYLFSGGDCLLTKGNISTEQARADDLKRNNPEAYKKLKEEAYVIGEGNPSPAVVTFTTQVASMAVNELLNRIQGYNQNYLDFPHKLFFFHKCGGGSEIFPANKSDNECRICGQSNYWGRGDMQPFLDMSN